MVIDFLIGLFAVNALPHYLFGRMNIQVLSLFGYSAKGNLCYAAFCLAVSVGLFTYQHGLQTIGERPTLVGVLFVVICYMALWDLVNRFLRKDV